MNPFNSRLFNSRLARSFRMHYHLAFRIWRNGSGNQGTNKEGQMRIQGHVIFLAAAMAAALTMGCSTSDVKTDLGTDVPAVDVPADVPVDVPADVPADVSTDVPIVAAKCLQCMKSGIAMRFSKLDVKEPSEPMGLPEFLNAIWAPDINASRLNVILRIDSVTPPTVEGDKVTKMTATVGSAWHNLTMGQILPVDSLVVPDEYYFLSQGTNTFNLDLKEDCTFQSVGDAFLGFHPGPLDHGLICSGGMPSLDLAPDTIPMARLDASGRINDDCTMVLDAKLSGCIAQEAACQICSFGPAPDYGPYARTPNADKVAEPCQASYCEHYCARGLWVNFGRFVQDLGVPLACDFDKSGANNGYLIAGDWEAKAVKFGVEPTPTK